MSIASSRRSGRRSVSVVCGGLLLGVALLGAPRPAAAHVAPLSDRQMVHASENVVVATVESGQARWNGQGLIVTDYVLRVEDRLKGMAPERVTVTIPGGTVGEETHHTCVTTPFAMGDRYLLFLGDLERPSLTPVTGAWQGMLHEVRGEGGQRFAAPGTSSSPLLAKGAPVTFARMVETVRARVAELDALPRIPQRKALEPRMPLPAKVHVRSAAAGDGAVAPVSLLTQPLVEEVAEEKGAVAGGAEQGSASLVSTLVRDEKFQYFAEARTPIVFNQLTPGMPFAGYDQSMMGYWNLYSPDLFQVFAAPSNTWDYGNDVFDFVGFLDNGDMMQAFGQSWGEGTLGITFSRVLGGELVEADVVLNAGLDWTADEAAGTDPDGFGFSFLHTVLHELGHAWGLEHPWEHQDVWWDSVMNYAPLEFRLARLYADDVQAVTGLYGGRSLRDGLLSAHVTGDVPGDDNALYAAVRPTSAPIRTGGSFGLSLPITLENVGTENLVNPTVEVYLTPNRLSLAGKVKLKSARFKVNARPGDIWRLNVGSLKVPKSVRPGTYYLAFVLKDPKDRFQGNNVTWTVYDGAVTITR